MIKVRNLLQAFSATVMALLISSPAFAQVDTATDSLTGVQDWFQQWIPLACFLVIVGCALAWMANVLRMDFAIRLIGGMIIIGSASYLVSLFGL